MIFLTYGSFQHAEVNQNSSYLLRLIRDSTLKIVKNVFLLFAMINSRKTPTDDFWGEVIAEIKLAYYIPTEELKGISDISKILEFFTV